MEIFGPTYDRTPMFPENSSVDVMDAPDEDEELCNCTECTRFAGTALVYTRCGRAIAAFILMILIYLIVAAISSSNTAVNSLADLPVRERANVNKSRAIGLLHGVCEAYDDGILSGDLCNKLCFKRQWNIHDFYEESKVVIILKDGNANGDTTTVLKSSKSTFSDFKKPLTNTSQDFFYNEVLDVINTELELEWPPEFKRHLMEFLWPTLLRTPGEPMLSADRASLWALLQQPEFIIFRLLPLSRVTPNVIGTCGHFYQIETLVPFTLRKHYMNLRAKILSHVMGTLKLLYEFLSEPLEWCSVDYARLGLSGDYPKRFMMMNGDSVYTSSRLRAIFENTPCTTDSDCLIGTDCTSTCLDDGYCSSERSNTNLEVVCEKLVKPLYDRIVSKHNDFLVGCFNHSKTVDERLATLRQGWLWSLADV